ncbi:cobalamin-binding protein [Pararobbsia silviterrae]|uniref:cobalamin-binding protein n=1 Tax=Pararobbsia silviterrae TaxID=1792498 RepID=UPI003B837535
MALAPARPGPAYRISLKGAACALSVTLVASHAHAAAITVTDDSGAVVTLQAPAHRVISLAPHTTELIYAAGGADAIVGAVSFSDYPSAARALPRVGDNQALDLEKIVALKPDLLVVWRHGNVAQQIDALRALGIPMFESEPKRLPEIAQNLHKLGALMGTEAVADHAAADFTARIDALRARYAQRSPVRVFYQIWDNPPMTLSGQHMVSDVIALCGGQNVFASLAPIAPTVSTEAVIAANPEAIVTGRYDDSPHAGTDDRARDASSPQATPALPKSLDRWKAWPQIAAVAHDNLFSVNADWMDRAGPRIADGAGELCAELDVARRHLGR